LPDRLSEPVAAALRGAAGRLAGVDAGGPVRPGALARADGGCRARGAGARRARPRSPAGHARRLLPAAHPHRDGKGAARRRVPGPGSSWSAAAGAASRAHDLRGRRPAAPRDLPRAARGGARRRLAALPPGPYRGRLATGDHHQALGRRVKVLFLVTRLPVPPWRGDQVRAYHHLRQLAPRHDITCCALLTRQPPAELRAAVQALGVRLEVVPLGTVGAAPALARALLGDARPLQVLLYLRTGARRRVTELMHSGRFDLVHAQLVRTAPYLPDADRAPEVLDLFDALSANLPGRA